MVIVRNLAAKRNQKEAEQPRVIDRETIDDRHKDAEDAAVLALGLRARRTRNGTGPIIYLVPSSSNKSN